MTEQHYLTQQFEASRQHLHKVAYRMLGSGSEAEDAVQEAWIRLNRVEVASIENLTGWLTTVVARVCLDMLRARKSNHDTIDDNVAEIAADAADNVEAELLQLDLIGPALLLLLDMLTPAERVAFVLHDVFELPFAEIAAILELPEASARQHASRARRRIRGATTAEQDTARQQSIVAAFLLAAREGNFDALLRLLHPDVVLRADATAIKISTANKAKGAPEFAAEIRGADKVAATFKGRAAGAQLAMINGLAGGTWGVNGKAMVAFCFTVADGKIATVNIVMDRAALDSFDIQLINTNNGVTA